MTAEPEVAPLLRLAFAHDPSTEPLGVVTRAKGKARVILTVFFDSTRVVPNALLPYVAKHATVDGRAILAFASKLAARARGSAAGR